MANRKGSDGQRAKQWQREMEDRAQPPAERLEARPRVTARDVPAPRAEEDLDLDDAPVHDAGFEALVHRMLALLHEDPSREGLRKTPQRVANSLTWLTRGYEMDVRDVVGDAVFDEEHASMVMVRDIELYSMCEHHMLPFFGKAHIAYIPNGRIVGLSKMARVVDVFARRLQVQERMTDQVAEALETELRPHGVGVVIEASHLCMMMRGVEKQNSRTITSAMRGTFLEDMRTREEFLGLVHGTR